RLARPKVPPASRLTPTGSETFAVTVAAGPEPVLSTLNPTMPVAPCDSVPTELIRAAICACGAGAVDDDAEVGALPGAAEDGAGAAAAGWLPGAVAGSVGAAAGGRAWRAGAGPECPVSARAAAARPTTAAAATPAAAACWPLGACRNQP